MAHISADGSATAQTAIAIAVGLLYGRKGEEESTAVELRRRELLRAVDVMAELGNRPDDEALQYRALKVTVHVLALLRFEPNPARYLGTGKSRFLLVTDHIKRLGLTKACITEEVFTDLCSSKFLGRSAAADSTMKPVQTTPYRLPDTFSKSKLRLQPAPHTRTWNQEGGAAVRVAVAAGMHGPFLPLMMQVQADLNEMIDPILRMQSDASNRVPMEEDEAALVAEYHRHLANAVGGIQRTIDTISIDGVRVVDTGSIDGRLLPEVTSGMPNPVISSTELTEQMLRDPLHTLQAARLEKIPDDWPGWGLDTVVRKAQGFLDFFSKRYNEDTNIQHTDFLGTKHTTVTHKNMGINDNMSLYEYMMKTEHSAMESLQWLNQNRYRSQTSHLDLADSLQQVKDKFKLVTQKIATAVDFQDEVTRKNTESTLGRDVATKAQANSYTQQLRDHIEGVEGKIRGLTREKQELDLNLPGPLMYPDSRTSQFNFLNQTAQAALPYRHLSRGKQEIIDKFRQELNAYNTRLQEVSEQEFEPLNGFTYADPAQFGFGPAFTEKMAALLAKTALASAGGLKKVGDMIEGVANSTMGNSTMPLLNQPSREGALKFGTQTVNNTVPLGSDEQGYAGYLSTGIADAFSVVTTTTADFVGDHPIASSFAGASILIPIMWMYFRKEHNLSDEDALKNATIATSMFSAVDDENYDNFRDVLRGRSERDRVEPKPEHVVEPTPVKSYAQMAGDVMKMFTSPFVSLSLFSTGATAKPEHDRLSPENIPKKPTDRRSRSPRTARTTPPLAEGMKEAIPGLVRNPGIDLKYRFHHHRTKPPPQGYSGVFDPEAESKSDKARQSRVGFLRQQAMAARAKDKKKKGPNLTPGQRLQARKRRIDRRKREFALRKRKGERNAARKRPLIKTRSAKNQLERQRHDQLVELWRQIRNGEHLI